MTEEIRSFPTDFLAAARELAGDTAEPIVVDGHEEFVARHKDFAIESLDRFRLTPRRVKEVVQVGDLESLVAYVLRYIDKHQTVGFAFNNMLGVILDYHTPNAVVADGGAVSASATAAAWGDHRAVYVFEETPEWTEWLENDGKRIGQIELGEFIEDHVQQIVEPTPASLLKIVEQFTETRTATFVSGVQVQSGAVKLQFMEDARQGEFTIPPAIKLALKPFKYGPSYEVTAKMRYRIQEGRLVIWYDLMHTDKVLDDAVEDFIKQFRAAAAIPVFRTVKIGDRF